MSTSAALTLEQGAAHLAAIVGEEHAMVRGKRLSRFPLTCSRFQKCCDSRTPTV